MDHRKIDAHFKSDIEYEIKKGDVTAEFMHADVPHRENIYAATPRGFRKKLLKSRKNLYGLMHSPREFWKYLAEKLEKCKLK